MVEWFEDLLPGMRFKSEPPLTQGGPDEAVPTARAITGRGRGDNVSVQSTLTRNPANGAGIRPRTRVN